MLDWYASLLGENAMGAYERYGTGNIEGHDTHIHKIRV